MKYLNFVFAFVLFSSCDLTNGSAEKTKQIEYRVTPEGVNGATKADIKYYDYLANQVVTLPNQSLPWNVVIHGKPSTYFFVSAKVLNGSKLKVLWTNNVGSEGSTIVRSEEAYGWISSDFCVKGDPSCAPEAVLAIIRNAWR